MDLTAVFESWHIGDGNYPPLYRGQLVRLSFQLEPARLTVDATGTASCLLHVGNAEYRGTGRVLRRYNHEGKILAVIEADDLRFYVDGPKAVALEADTAVQFEGTLLLDYYAWVEFLERYADPPDLFYNLMVARIRKVGIPDRFVQRSSRSVAYPTRVPPEAFGSVEELETMVGQHFDQEFYIIDFSDANLAGIEVPRTFQ